MRKLFYFNIGLLFSFKILAAATLPEGLPNPTVATVSRPSTEELTRVLGVDRPSLFKGMVYKDSSPMIEATKALINRGADFRILPLSVWQNLAVSRPDLVGALLVHLRYSPGFVRDHEDLIMATLPEAKQTEFRRAKLEADAKQLVERALSTGSKTLPQDHAVFSHTEIADFLAPALCDYTASNTPAGIVTSKPRSTVSQAFYNGIRDAAWHRRGTTLIAQYIDAEVIEARRTAEREENRHRWQHTLRDAMITVPRDEPHRNVLKRVVRLALTKRADLKAIPLEDWITIVRSNSSMVLAFLTEARYGTPFVRANRARLLPEIAEPTSEQLSLFTTFSHPLTHTGAILEIHGSRGVVPIFGRSESGFITGPRRLVILLEAGAEAWYRRGPAVVGSALYYIRESY